MAFNETINWISQNQNEFNILALFITIVSILLTIYFGKKSKKDEETLVFALKYGKIIESLKKEKELSSAEIEALNKKKEMSSAEVEALKNNIHHLNEMKIDIEKKLPDEANRAYYENLIPILQKQIFDLKVELDDAINKLRSYGGEIPNVPEAISKMLSEDILLKMSRQQRLEKMNLLLTIFLALLVGSTQYRFFGEIFGPIFGFGVLYIGINMMNLYLQIYLERKPKKKGKSINYERWKNILRIK